MNKEVDVYIGSSCIKGSCIYDDGRYIVDYSDKVSDEGDIVIYRLVINPDSLRIYQGGAVRTCLIYKADGLTYDFSYCTEYGSIDMQLKTSELYIDITDSYIHIEADYTLCQEGDSAERNILLIDIKNG